MGDGCHPKDEGGRVGGGFEERACARSRPQTHAAMQRGGTGKNHLISFLYATLGDTSASFAVKLFFSFASSATFAVQLQLLSAFIYG